MVLRTYNTARLKVCLSLTLRNNTKPHWQRIEAGVRAPKIRRKCKPLFLTNLIKKNQTPKNEKKTKKQKKKRKKMNKKKCETKIKYDKLIRK